ncbi:hypothetical protein KJS94_08370 [Flavihumibacter rivuli]|uniref:hypothetical protein n=1 Tax=Flavihumibacter rivuli TaxID=2838156 RepID=UPI001BDEAD23|nr:hypothetical protein [Flavihumibacter rivuli]ULQ58209.1 hypothetical protein KJS94_08370 [Flavihumibacter rivuli]
MSTPNPFAEEKEQLPSTLNVLTILTLIWSGIELILSVWGFASGKKNLEQLEELEASGKLDDMPEFMKRFSGPEAMENARLAFENRIPILVIALVAVGLCIFGALEMRKRKKNGYYFWLIGELLPFVSGFLFLKPSSLLGFGLVFPFLFIILYTTQLKHLRS